MQGYVVEPLPIQAAISSFAHAKSKTGTPQAVRPPFSGRATPAASGSGSARGDVRPRLLVSKARTLEPYRIAVQEVARLQPSARPAKPRLLVEQVTELARITLAGRRGAEHLRVAAPVPRNSPAYQDRVDGGGEGTRCHAGGRPPQCLDFERRR